MKKLLVVLFMLIGLNVFAQGNPSFWSQDYYGAGKSYSDSLIITEGENLSGEYYIGGQLAIIKVDSNWTASNIGFMVYNPLEEVWEMLTDESGTVIEIVVATGEPATVPPIVSVGLKRIKFVKVSSGVLVDQITEDTKIAIETARFN